MKLILCMSLCLLSLAAVAGPEERRDAQSCYYPVAQNSDNKISSICLETISVDLRTEELSIYSYFMPELFKNLKINTLSRRNENGFSLRTKGTISSTLDSKTCSGEHVSLILNGQLDNDGVTEAQYLDISTETAKYDSNCNLNVEVLKYRYW